MLIFSSSKVLTRGGTCTESLMVHSRAVGEGNIEHLWTHFVNKCKIIVIITAKYSQCCYPPTARIKWVAKFFFYLSQYAYHHRINRFCNACSQIKHSVR